MFKFWARIKRPADVFKQPWQGLLRLVGAAIYSACSPFRDPRPLPHSPQSMLVIRRNNIGDAVITGLIIRSILSANHNLRVTIVANNYSADVFRYLLPETTLIVLPERYLGMPLGLYFHPLVRRLRRQLFDIAINGSGSYSSKAIFFMACIRAKYRVAAAHRTKHQFLELLLDDAVHLDDSLQEQHQMLRIAAVFERTGLKFQRPATCGSDAPINRIMLCPESNRAASRWPIDRWRDLFQKLEAMGYDVHYCVSPRYTSELTPSIRPLNTAALIKALLEVDLVICQEGGVSHLAAVCNKHIITLSGVAIRNTWFPWSRSCVLLENTGNICQFSAEDIVQAVIGKSVYGSRLDPSMVG